MFEYLNNKRVLITGAGTLAYGLAQKLNCELAVYSRNEASQFSFGEVFQDARMYMGDVCDRNRLIQVFRSFKPEIVIHTAAAKRVDVAQKEPLNTIYQNIVGTMNVAEVSINENVEAVIGIGTDKEVDPQTIYGWTKALGNAALLDYDKMGDTKFSVVRYGNVLCSRSSVGVIWLDAARAGKKLKVTNPNMTRFFFTIEDGVRLIEYGLNKTLLTPNGHGRIYSTEMCAGTLQDLAEAIDSEYNCGIEIIGSRVVEEKLHEVLIGKKERDSTIKTNDVFYPPYSPSTKLHYLITSPDLTKTNMEELVTSENAPRLSKEELLNMLQTADKITFKG